LLKEKSFYVDCKEIYNTLGELWYSHYSSMNNNYVDPGATCTAPEQWMVVEWLRIKHGIWISVGINGLDKTFQFSIHCYEQQGSLENINNCGYGTPEEACSAAFSYILSKLI
jgi:hypothetical protein